MAACWLSSIGNSILQYVKNIALMNLLTIEQGKGRFVMMDDSMWGMILGKSGKIPGEIDPEQIGRAHV